jgi:hypothetical protein
MTGTCLEFNVMEVCGTESVPLGARASGLFSQTMFAVILVSKVEDSFILMVVLTALAISPTSTSTPTKFLVIVQLG